MSMYLPNPDLGPTGFEPGEFIDIDMPVVAEEDQPDGPGDPAPAHDHPDRRVRWWRRPRSR